MKTVGSFEAKTHFSNLLEQVGKGERFTITKHGVPVAMLIPLEIHSHEDRLKAIQELRTFREGNSLPEGMTIRDLINEGRRF